MNEPWKVIARDNFNRDTVNDRFIAEWETKEDAIASAERINNWAGGPDSQWYYVAVPSTYVLRVWQP